MTDEVLPLDSIRPNPQNPRDHIREDRISELAASIEKQGLLQPVSVRPDGDGYELIHGERRYRAVSKLGWGTIRAEVRDLSDREALEVSITENLQREDVNPIAEARSYQALIEEFDLTQAEAAERLGKSQSHISNRVQLLDLPDRLQRSILHQIFTPWQAREIGRVWGDYWIYDLALGHGLSVAELRELADDLEDGVEIISVDKELSRGALTFFYEEIPPCQKSATHGLLWAHHNVEGYQALDKYDKWDPEPIKIDWPRQRIIEGFGYERLDVAETLDYTGEFEVELLYPTEMLEWEHRYGGEASA